MGVRHAALPSVSGHAEATADVLGLILDSHAPRGFDHLESWRLVCAGQALPGAERAGDIAVALDALAEMEDVTDDVVLLGASHGGWTAMEFVGLALTGEVPPGLTQWPSEPDMLLAHVSALVVLYPYCGALNGADAISWPDRPPLLMILAENDSIVSTPNCLEAAATLRQGGASVTSVVLAGADHGFDQRERSVLSSLKLDADLRDQATRDIADFLSLPAVQ
ncbi:dienelactone hydrolase [Aliiruegeria haliotis]|uniref:Dienelactone hydrolase n=1 Tax=Aliiruegeria haliotis TaxID=1280846 RepID=A0A2T0RF53_9RHOB|nr:hypothetical protein [Aliiruegeria haliotis]PRY19769.1 dienelactone hydrolase [Aliiruegeria haliotis]